MRRKLTLRCVLISLITAVIVFAVALGVVFWLYDETESDDIKDKTHLLTAALQSAEDPSSVLAAIDDTRVTLVDADGNVVYDSYGATDNHGDREEIIAAMNGEPEVVGRYSQTMGAHAYYYAEKFTAGGNTYVLRLCERRSDIGPYIGAAVGALVLAAAVGIAVSAVFARRMSGSISARLGEINNRLHALTLATPGTSAAGGDEFAEIAEEIDALVAGLGGSLADLRREQSKLDFVINNISQGMMAFSSHNEIVLYNKPVCKIFKVKDDIMGRHFSYLTKDEELKTLMHNALMRGEDGEFSYRLRGKDLNFKVYSFKTDDESGEIEHIVLVADLTKEKAAIRQKSEFFANASHELKTPLTTMQGLTEILLAKAGDEGQKKQLERIYKESKRLSFLVQDMLYISDLESGRAERREEDIDLGAVAAEVRQEYSHQAEERDVTINVSGSGHVRADYRNIYEIVGNLCSNAVHYNVPGGKVDMDIRTDGGQVILTVSDTGIGIPEEHLPKVCERFYRVDKSRSKKTGGTGLGLAIVKHVCNLYGAKLNIQSKVGEGTVVQVVFSPGGEPPQAD